MYKFSIDILVPHFVLTHLESVIEQFGQPRK